MYVVSERATGYSLLLHGVFPFGSNESEHVQTSSRARTRGLLSEGSSPVGLFGTRLVGLQSISVTRLKALTATASKDFHQQNINKASGGKTVHARIYIHKHVRTRRHAPRTHAQTQSFTHTHTHTHTYLKHTHAHTQMPKCTDTHTWRDGHGQAHTHTHTH